MKHLGLWFVTMDPVLKNRLHSSLDVGAQPLETFIETITAGGTGSLLRCSWISCSTFGKNVKTRTWMNHVRCLSPCNPSLSVISAAFMALGRSCLLAKTRRMASRSSSSFNIRCNSSRASEIRSRSFESTTKMIPWVFWKSEIVELGVRIR